MSTGEFLLAKYGPLMTLENLAEVLKRKVDGLRTCLRKQSPFYRALSSARVRLGRHIYFSTPVIGRILEDDTFIAGQE